MGQSVILFASITVGLGLLLRFAVSLRPTAWMAWLAPGLLLALVLQPTSLRLAKPWWWWRLCLLGACLIGHQVNAGYYSRVMGSSLAAMAVIAGQSLIWLFVFSETRRVILTAEGSRDSRRRAWWIVFVYPVFWVAMDTLMAALLPDGNWASLAYSQSDFLPLMQVASIFGVGGVFFLLSLLPSAVAVGWAAGWPRRRYLAVLTGVIVLEGFACGWGALRLRSGSDQSPGPPLTIGGMVSVDDAIGLQATPAYIRTIQSAYDSQIAAAAVVEKARLILLPEKIALVEEHNAAQWQQQWSDLARRHSVWLAAGLAIRMRATGSIVNQAWLFDPEGTRRVVYDKHFLAPPERREYVNGRDFGLMEVAGRRMGIAICKDMHFASLGREYGRRGASVMLVPAWDFIDDAWMASRMTAVRGIESGFAIVRASREGLLGVTDAYGRVIAERASRPLPGGERLVAPLPGGDRIQTFYTEFGYLFGWICVALAAGLMIWSRRVHAVSSTGAEMR